MNKTDFLQVQSIELQGLLQMAGDDPILGTQLQDRLNEVNEQLQAQKQPGRLFEEPTQPLPRAAIFLRGRDVKESKGISATFAGEALIQYEKMFTEQALHDERQVAKASGRERRPKGAITPGLLFTGTPRGSFGLEFVPQIQPDDSLVSVHSQSLRNIADALTSVTESNVESLDKVLNSIPPRVLQPMKQFLETLSRHEAELRIAFEDHQAHSLTVSQVKTAADLLQREVFQDTITLTGMLRGVTLDSGIFDFRVSDGSLITGSAADSLTEEDLEQISQLTNKQCKAIFQKTVVRKVSGAETVDYVLIEAHAIEP